MNDAEIERLYRIKSSLPPAQRAEIERLHAEMLARSGGPMSPNPVRSWGPEDLDPVEAAAAPITPDPIAGPVRARSRADWATDAVTAGGLYSPSENVASMDVTDVPSPGEVGNAQRTLYHRDRRLAERGAGPMPEDAMEPEATTRDRYNRMFGTGAYERDAAGRASRGGGRQPVPAGYDEWAAATAEAETGKTKAERMAEIDALERRQDAQKASYDQATGMPSPGGSGLADVDEAGRDWSGWTPGMPLPAAAPSGAVLADNARRAEAARVREADALTRNEAIGTKYGPQARGIAEAGDAEGVTDYAAVQTKTEKFRNDYRRGNEMLARTGNDAARNELRAQDARGAEARNKFRAAAATTGTSGMPSEAERWNNYRAQMMLAGSNPRKNQVNAWSMMNDPNVSEEQRRSLQYMLPGGQLAAGVDANNAASAAKMAQNAVTAFLTNNPAAGQLNPLQQQQLNNAQSQQQQSAVDWARNHVATNYAEEQGVGNYLNRTAAWIGLPVHDNTEFTVEEQDKAIRALMVQYPHLTLAQATQIIDSVGATRSTAPRPAAARPGP